MSTFKKISTMFLLLLSVALYSQTKTSFQDGSDRWEVEVKKMRGHDTLVMHEKTSDRTLSYQSESVAHSFVRMSSLTFSKDGPLHFITIWKKGAHGESVKVLNTAASNSKDLVAFSYNSAWPLEYEYKDHELIIYGKGEMQADGTPKEEIKKYSP